MIIQKIHKMDESKIDNVKCNLYSSMWYKLIRTQDTNNNNTKERISKHDVTKYIKSSNLTI